MFILPKADHLPHILHAARDHRGTFLFYFLWVGVSKCEVYDFFSQSYCPVVLKVQKKSILATWKPWKCQTTWICNFFNDLNAKITICDVINKAHTWIFWKPSKSLGVMLINEEDSCLIFCLALKTGYLIGSLLQVQVFQEWSLNLSLLSLSLIPLLHLHVTVFCKTVPFFCFLLCSY